MLVNDIYLSLQGEGCLAGTPMVILRLQGCSVGCPFCDTKETWYEDIDKKVSFRDALGTSENYSDITENEIVGFIRDNFKNTLWVLVTGGEPAEQDLGRLTSCLSKANYRIALETSGTATGHENAILNWNCVSPKIGMPGQREIIPWTIRVADELKFVIGCQKDLDVVSCFLAKYSKRDDCQVCLQPMSTNQKATELCIETCMRMGYRLSLQRHKLIKMR